MVKIDSHQHFWQYHPVNHQWISDEMSVLKQDFLPGQLSDLLTIHGFEGTVAVQADQSEAETEFLLNLAKQYPFIKGVVGWVDLQASDVEQRLEYFQRYPKLKGFRHVVQSEPDDSFLLREAFLGGVAKLARYHYTYDILIYPRQLPATLLFVNQFPDQKFVVDHIAKPNIKAGDFEKWGELMQELSQYPNVWCKVSGMVTEADWRQWTPADFERYIEHVFSCFGPERIMFGSDWPVCLLAASYSQVVEIFDTFTSGLPWEAQNKVWGGNARSFYQL